MKADKDMVEIAARIIGQKAAAFDPAEFKDHYDDALREMIAAKSKGQGLVEAPRPDDTNVIDLMEALRNSLNGASAAARVNTARPAPAVKKRVGKKPASKPASKRKAS